MPDDGFDTGNPAGFVRGLISEGESATSGLAIFREAGGEIRDSRWYALYSNVNDTLARGSQAVALDPFTVPGPTDYAEWEAGRGGQYATQVEIQIVDRDTGLWFTKLHTYITDEPHTPAEAEADAFDVFGDPDIQNDYGETVMGALATSVFLTTPFGG